MRLVYWGLAIGGFVLVISWLWGALVAFSLILLLIIGYEIWRQSRPLALSNRSRKTKPEDDLVGLQSEAPLNAAVKPTAKPAAKFRVRLVAEKLVKNSGKSDLAQPTSAIPSQFDMGGDRTVLQEPLTLLSDANADAIAEAIQDIAQSNTDLVNAPTVIESLDQVHFTQSAEIVPNKADLAEEPTTQPRRVSKFAKPSRQPSPWNEPLTTPRLSPNPPSNPTVIRPPASTSKPTVAKPFQPQSADEPTIARPLHPTSSADEKTVVGPLKAKTGNEPTIVRLPEHDLSNVTDRKTADEDSTSPPAANTKASPLQSTDPEEPTVIGQTQSLKQDERTTL